MQRGNGAVIGKQNTPTTSVATGVWALNEVQRAVLNGTWPAAAVSDPYFENVTMLLHGDGTNGAQNNTFLDSSTNNFTITRNGNTTQGTFTPFGSNWSNYFDGTGDYITSSQSQTIPATGDFTIDGWFWCNTYTNYPSILSQGTSGNAGRFNIYINNDGKFGVQIGATANNIGSAVPTNQWVHFAVTRSGSTVTVYINGASIGTATNGTSVQNTTPSIGSEWSGDPYRWIGYLSNIRVSNVVRTISLPASPFVADANTVLLTCQSNRFIDTSTTAATLTPNGNVSVQRFSPFNPTAPYAAGTDGGSGYFDGSGDYLTAANNAAFRIGSGDFTVEGWVYFPTGGVEYGIISQFNSGGTGPGWTIYKKTTNVIEFYGGSGTITVTGTTALMIGAWNHFAVVRNGSTITIYVNGVAGGTGTNSSFTDETTTALYVGARADGVPMTGYASNLRIVKGTAVYTANFTPSTTPLTAITNTQLLLNFTNAGIIDNAEMNNLETVGNAQISTSVKKFGTGSLSFDGNGDYLQLPNRSILSLEGDFTIEGWIYVNSLSAGSSTFLQLGDTSNYIILYISSSDGTFRVAGTVSITSGTVSTGAWKHFALVRNGTASGNIKAYVDGVNTGSATSTATFVGASNNGLRIGAEYPSNYYLNGYIDDFRITKGYARYTANFTAPTAPFPDF